MSHAHIPPYGGPRPPIGSWNIVGTILYAGAPPPFRGGSPVKIFRLKISWNIVEVCIKISTMFRACKNFLLEFVEYCENFLLEKRER
jgi:hypothetical protein